MFGTISKAQACLLLLPLIYVCLQALKWPTSEQWEVNVHKQNTWLIWLISFLVSSLTLSTQHAGSSQQGRRRELAMGEINWSSWPIEFDSCCCLLLKGLTGASGVKAVVGISGQQPFSVSVLVYRDTASMSQGTLKTFYRCWIRLFSSLAQVQSLALWGLCSGWVLSGQWLGDTREGWY